MSNSAAIPDRPAVRLAHLSDVHICPANLDWRLADWFNKRLTGWFNLRWLGRGKSFHLAERVLSALAAELGQRPQVHVVFSGDATSLGFAEECERAAELLRVRGPHALPGIAVPGNHDYYTRGAARSGLFERYFAPWQTGERVGDAVYPFAQDVGPVWLIGVNSSTGNRWFWDAAGSVGQDQLARLAILLKRLDNRPRILVTHYPACLASGEPEKRYHGLRDLTDLVRVAREGGICLWLHGHRHTAYHLTCSRFAPFPLVCAGTATQEGRWSYGDYTITGRHFHAVRRVYSPADDCFVDHEIFDLDLVAGLPREEKVTSPKLL